MKVVKRPVGNIIKLYFSNLGSTLTLFLKETVLTQTHTHSNWVVMDVLINLTMIITQCICISHHHIQHFEYIQSLSIKYFFRIQSILPSFYR